MVGAKLGAALRHAMEKAGDGTTQDGGRSVRPHIRRAHWHAYLLGPRSGTRRRDVRWMPPMPIAVDDYDELVPTIHPVHEERHA